MVDWELFGVGTLAANGGRDYFRVHNQMPGLRAIIQFLAAAALLLLGAIMVAAEPAPAGTPAPRWIVIGQPLQPADENQPAEAEGVVTFAGRQGPGWYLEIGSEAGSMPVNLLRGSSGLMDLLPGSRILVRGICTPLRRSLDGKITGGLSAASLNDITILQLPEERWRQYPVWTIHPLAETNAPGQIIHLRGRVESVSPGRSFLLADQTGRVTVQSGQASPDVGADIEALGAWPTNLSNRVFECGFFRTVTQAANPVSPPVLTTTDQIRWMKPAEAALGLPVKVRGVITFLRSGGGNIQDGGGGVFLWEMWNLNPTNPPPKVGDYCEVEGVVSPGDFSPMVLCRKLTVLGDGQLPEPLHPSWDELAGGGLDAQWVEISGVVLSATNHDVDLGVKGGRLACRLSRTESLDHLPGAIVRVRGVVLASHDKARHIIGVRINVPSFKFISVETPAPDYPFLAPVSHVRDLFTYNPNVSAFRQVKVAGQVVFVGDGVFHVMDGTNGLRLIPKDGSAAAVGDLVEAVGFPDLDSPFDQPLLTLREAVVRRTGSRPLPLAVAVAADDLLNREHDSTLVRLDARLLGVNLYRAEQVLELQTGKRIYLARLKTSSGQFPPLQLDSRLAVTGVYAVSSEKAVPFELLLNSPADARVLELPSWWTAQHALVVVCAMALLILLAVAWIGLLQQQVGRRTAALRNEIAERRRAENELVQARLQHMVEQERTRIARDLHDDLGSRVTRMVLLLDELALQNQVPANGTQKQPPEIAAAAGEIIQSLDETVWAVNPRNDTLAHLINYLSQFAIEFLRLAGVRCRLDFPDYPPPRMISAETRHNLFLAAKEALNNAVRHAQATTVWLRMDLGEETLALTIEDDGRGFAVVAGDSSGDGLRNMRQRMETIGGRFEIVSAPGKGARVTLTCSWSPGK